jgi:acyl-CoA synthetase (AMP-forming)/AMP-acid ligase II
MSLPALLDARVEETDGSGRVISVRGELTYADWQLHAASVAEFLREHLDDLRGERVLLWMTNDDALDFLAVAHSCFLHSAIAVGLDDRSTAAEVRRLIDETEPRALILSSLVASNLGAAGLDALGLDPTLAGEDEPTMHAVPIAEGANAAALSFRVADLPGADFSGNAAASDDAIIFFSSGSTGHPKGAVWRQGDLVQYVERAAHAIYSLPRGGKDLGPEDTLQSPIPVYTAASVVENPYAAVLAGCTLVYEARRFDAQKSEQRMTDLGTTIYNGAPPHFAMMCDLPPASAPPALELMVSGGSAFTPALYGRIRARWDVAVANWYGLMESGCGQTLSYGEDIERKPGSIGRAVEPTELRIVDDDFEDVAHGNEGELWLRGPAQMREYFRNPEQTAKRLHQGWLRTGDRALIDELGLVHMVGRNEERINRGGFKFYPVEIEAILEEDERVREVAVVGVPDEVLGQLAVAFVVPARGQSVTEDDLRHLVRARVAANKVPSRVVFVERFPRSAYGKVVRRELVKQYEEGTATVS